MSSEEGEKKNVEEKTQNDVSSAEEDNVKEEEEKEEKANSKPAAKKKAADPPKIKQPAKKRVKTEQAEKEKEDKKEEKKKPETEEEDEDDDESEDENDVENHKVPLLDQPLEISGSRKRKEVQRFKPVQKEEDSKEVKIPEGKGVALGDIERVDFNIQRAKVEDLKLLHRLCFGKIGKAAAIKKTVKRFNGFDFEVSSEEFEKKKAYVEKNFKKVTVGNLKNICQILDIERGGTKEDLWERILSFLTSPVDSGKKLPGSGRSKRRGASSKNYDEGEDSFKSKKKGKSKKKEEDSDESENEDKDQSDEEEVKNDEAAEKAQTTEESEPEKEEEEEKEEKPKKTPGKKGKKGSELADKKAPPKKRAAAKKAAESEEDGDNETDNDDEPLVKKTKTPPTDEEIKTYVKSLLEGANLELITMKKVCQDVYAHYPDFDLGYKKDFIKTTVKSLISS